MKSGGRRKDYRGNTTSTELFRIGGMKKGNISMGTHDMMSVRQ